MLTTKKKIRKKSEKCFLQKFRNIPSVWPRESNNQNLKEICALGSEIIATRTDRRLTNIDFMGCAKMYFCSNLVLIMYKRISMTKLLCTSNDSSLKIYIWGSHSIKHMVHKYCKITWDFNPIK